jgi:hypothetical protein
MENLLDLSKIESGAVDLSREPAALDVLVKRALSALRYEIERRGLTLSTEIDPDLPPVCVDPNRVIQVLVNLVDNAAKYAASGGTVRVVARAVADGVEVAVRDNGRGIPASEQAAVFDRFYRLGRRGAAGTGLGLSIAKEIVESQHGRIWVQSEEGEGTTFYFTLPAYQADPSLARFVHDLRAHAATLGAPLTFSLMGVRAELASHAEDVVNAVMHASDAVFEYVCGEATVLVLGSFKGPTEARVNAERIERRLADISGVNLRWAFVEVGSDNDGRAVIEATRTMAMAEVGST